VHRVGWLLALTAAASAEATALAYEGKISLDFEAGYARVLSGADLPRQGPMLGVASSIGLGDAWALRFRVSYAIHPGGDPLHVGVIGVEGIYLIDIVQLVPFFGLGIDAIGTLRAGDFGADPAVHAIVGLDYLVSPRILIGFDVRPYVLPLSINDLDGVDPVYLTVNARFGLLFDRPRR
jgi:hypothetical protein